MIDWLMGRIACWRGLHDFRRAYKAENQSLKFCRRCEATVEVKHRKVKEQSA